MRFAKNTTKESIPTAHSYQLTFKPLMPPFIFISSQMMIPLLYMTQINFCNIRTQN